MRGKSCVIKEVSNLTLTLHAYFCSSKQNELQIYSIAILND